MKILGIIPARKGSKGIPGKNIKIFSGKPLIAHTIESAVKSEVLDRVIVSTDSEEISKIAKDYGAEVPFIQPLEIAQDDTPMLDVVRYAADWLKKNDKYVPTHIMILQPTAPLRQPFHIRESANLIKEANSDSVVSVTEIPDHYSPYKAMVINDKNFLELFNGEPVSKRISMRQNLGKSYRSAGMIFLFKTELIFRPDGPNFYGENVLPYIIEEKYVADIDSQNDWQEAERLFAALT
jgi:CMP-N-acetylneuraminic acid synthetase